MHLTLPKKPSVNAANIGGAPDARAAPRKITYIATICAVFDAKK